MQLTFRTIEGLQSVSHLVIRRKSCQVINMFSNYNPAISIKLKTSSMSLTFILWLSVLVCVLICHVSYFSHSITYIYTMTYFHQTQVYIWRSDSVNQVHRASDNLWLSSRQIKYELLNKIWYNCKCKLYVWNINSIKIVQTYENPFYKDS